MVVLLVWLLVWLLVCYEFNFILSEMCSVYVIKFALFVIIFLLKNNRGVAYKTQIKQDLTHTAAGPKGGARRAAQKQENEIQTTF